MKNRFKLFPFALILAVLPLAGCFHSNYNPATALTDNKARLQQMGQSTLPHIDASSKETLDKITQLSQQDPAKASALVGELTANIDASTKETLDKLVHSSPQDPGETSALVRELAHNDLAKEAVIMTVAQSWFAKDPHAATDWLNTLPPGRPRDLGVEVILPDAVNQDPSTALGLANTISVAYERMRDLQGVVALWAKTDPAAAMAAVQSAKLTDIVYTMSTAEQERQNLLRVIKEASPPAE